MSYCSHICDPKTMDNHLQLFKNQYLEKFDFYAGNNADDIFLIFDGPASTYKLVMSHIFTIPFCITKKGLRRYKHWLRPLPHWRGIFLNCELTRIDSKTYEKDLYLEFNGEVALLTNKNLVSIYKNDTLHKTTMVQK